jgi:hypothetical protein
MRSEVKFPAEIAGFNKKIIIAGHAVGARVSYSYAAARSNNIS